MWCVMRPTGHRAHLLIQRRGDRSAFQTDPVHYRFTRKPSLHNCVVGDLACMATGTHCYKRAITQYTKAGGEAGTADRRLTIVTSVT